MPEDNVNIDMAELLAMIGEQQVMARKREQRINELQNKVKELEEKLGNMFLTGLAKENG